MQRQKFSNRNQMNESIYYNNLISTTPCSDSDSGGEQNTGAASHGSHHGIRQDLISEMAEHEAKTMEFIGLTVNGEDNNLSMNSSYMEDESMFMNINEQYEQSLKTVSDPHAPQPQTNSQSISTINYNPLGFEFNSNYFQCCEFTLRICIPIRKAWDEEYKRRIKKNSRSPWELFSVPDSMVERPVTYRNYGCFQRFESNKFVFCGGCKRNIRMPPQGFRRRRPYFQKQQYNPLYYERQAKQRLNHNNYRHENNYNYDYGNDYDYGDAGRDRRDDHDDDDEEGHNSNHGSDQNEGCIQAHNNLNYNGAHDKQENGDRNESPQKECNKDDNDGSNESPSRVYNGDKRSNNLDSEKISDNFLQTIKRESNHIDQQSNNMPIDQSVRSDQVLSPQKTQLISLNLKNSSQAQRMPENCDAKQCRSQLTEQHSNTQSKQVEFADDCHQELQASVKSRPFKKQTSFFQAKTQEDKYESFHGFEQNHTGKRFSFELMQPTGRKKKRIPRRQDCLLVSNSEMLQSQGTEIECNDEEVIESGAEQQEMEPIRKVSWQFDYENCMRVSLVQVETEKFSWQKMRNEPLVISMKQEYQGTCDLQIYKPSIRMGIPLDRHLWEIGVSRYPLRALCINMKCSNCREVSLSESYEDGMVFRRICQGCFQHMYFQVKEITTEQLEEHGSIV